MKTKNWQWVVLFRILIQFSKCLIQLKKLATGKGSKFQIFKLKICKLDWFKCGDYAQEISLTKLRGWKNDYIHSSKKRSKRLANFNQGLKAYYNWLFKCHKSRIFWIRCYYINHICKLEFPTKWTQISEIKFFVVVFFLIITPKT